MEALDKHIGPEQKAFFNTIYVLKTLFDLDYRFHIMDKFDDLMHVLTLSMPPVENITNPQKANELAMQVLSKMDDDGFIAAEGDRAYGVKYGADVGYEIDMSLWGLGLYAKLTNNHFVEQIVRESIKNHLYFVYPNGSIDGSWGIRSNKWTTYGSATADGYGESKRFAAPASAPCDRGSEKSSAYANLRRSIQGGYHGHVQTIAGKARGPSAGRTAK